MRPGRADVSIAIIGAGFSGLAMAIRLREAGIDDFTVFEAADGVGGTWRDNTYPGCACDIPSHLYSFSFARNPDWTRAYGPQAEILEYLERCTDEHGLRPHIRFGTEIRRLRYDEAENMWELEAGDGRTFRARVVVAGPGGLSRPSIPAIPGLDTFGGPVWHSARWNHEFELSGKHVAVIGTGASAIQIVPAIAEQVGHLYVFQRTAPWVVPKSDGPIPARMRELLARHPTIGWLHRSVLYWLLEALGVGFVVEPRLMQLRELLARRHIARQISDPELRERVTPEYTMGCKRVLFSDDYYPALMRDDVELVTDQIERVTPDGIVTRDGQDRKVDAIVLCTGFAVADFLAPVRILGRDGLDLNEAWRRGAEAYYGMSVSGFPNLFVMTGPNTGLGHNSMVFMIEAQAHYILKCIRMLRRGDVSRLEVLPEVQRRFNDRLQSRMGNVVWSSGCKSWYLDANGRNFTLWPGLTFEYWLRTRRVNKRAYRRT